MKNMERPEPNYVYKAKLIRVIDGDTAEFEVDLGFRMTARLPIRMLGINAPEINTRDGIAARAFASKWFETRSNPFTLKVMRNPEKYGRWLAIVVDQSGEIYNDAIVSAGLAVNKTY